MSSQLTLNEKMRYFLETEKLINQVQLTDQQRKSISPEVVEKVAFTFYLSEKLGRPSLLRVTHPLLWEEALRNIDAL
jgi:penicillin-binding protein-related factor A (putative recombinase)